MSPKKISQRDITGDRGIALIHSIVGEMGFVWNATGLEAGIDGIIEIRDVVTGEMTNLIIQVQSKATSIDFISETTEGFDYYCKTQDLDYWLGGNAPVILICSKPATNEAYWVSIKNYFNDLNKRASNKIHFEKDKNRFDVNARNALIEIAKPNDSGVYLSPLPKTETLISNLLPIKYFGEKLYIAETNYRSRKSVWEELKKLTNSSIGGEWILKNKQIISFQDLNEFPWNKICTTEAEGFDSTEWSETDSLEKKNDFINLLNLSLAQKLEPYVRYHKDFEYFYFIATKNLKPKELRYKSLIQQTKRAVFQVYRRAKDPTQVSHYRHSAFFGKFCRYNALWYLEITPTYHFTSDGYRTFLFREDQLIGIKRLERNPAVLGQVVMWADYLQDRPDLFNQPYPYLQFGELEKFVIDAGLDDKSWLKQEEEEEVKTATSPENQLLLFENENSI
ncbi:MAG: DUF4365 domain-containing protein [Anaerolineales bacterium]|nr:DUF4365 domain-containing protein [Anaerolineales bacterium]